MTPLNPCCFRSRWHAVQLGPSWLAHTLLTPADLCVVSTDNSVLTNTSGTWRKIEAWRQDYTRERPPEFIKCQIKWRLGQLKSTGDSHPIGTANGTRRDAHQQFATYQSSTSKRKKSRATTIAKPRSPQSYLRSRTDTSLKYTSGPGWF
jgi:hypothetical protein